MANERIKDAKALIDGKRWEFAYYAAGYAVECALKSCLLARMIYTGWIFDDNVKKVDDCRTHDFLKLIHIAGLSDELNTEPVLRRAMSLLEIGIRSIFGRSRAGMSHARKPMPRNFMLQSATIRTGC